MSQTARDLEGGKPVQSAPNQSSQGESSFGDSSGRLFSIYFNATKEEDDKMVEGWQKDAEGILIFTGLFSASVAVLLAVTVQDLRPSTQDTSAFYLGNIYEILADPNVTRSSTPSSVAKPPPFSPPRYSVWVNSLWFLSLVMSISCALWATLLQRWARRYIRLTQPARRSPDKRARIREFFADGVDKMHIPWAVEGLPALLHLSLFLFLGGLVVFLFNVDREVFASVVWWIVLFSMVYGLVTLLPLIQHNSPYSAPLSFPAWFLYTSILYVTFKALAFITPGIRSYDSYQIQRRYHDLSVRYRGWMLGGVEKKAEEMAEEQSSEIDVRILNWTIGALGDDISLEGFFGAIPGFFNSKLVKHLEKNFPETLLNTFWGALAGFMGRTSSVSESVKNRRDVICRDIMDTIPYPYYFARNNLPSWFDRAPLAVPIERLQAMARWFTHSSPYISDSARDGVIWHLPRLQERDIHWITLASDACGLEAHVIRLNVAMGGNDMLLATLIHVSRQAIYSDKPGMFGLVKELTKFDIRHTRRRQQLEFCKLWNEFIQKASFKRRYTAPNRILSLIRHLHISLHQGIVAAPTSTTLEPSSHYLCDNASHRPHPTAHLPVTPCARGLVNTGNMCFANAVLQLLVHSPPLWDLFRQRGDLKGQRGTGVPEIGGGATPLVDATVRFFEEFMNKEEPPPTQLPPRQAAGGKPREDEEAKKEPNVVDSFEPTYVYDAMKEKRRLKSLLGGEQQDAEEFFRFYLDALDEELLALLDFSGHNSANAAPGVEEREVVQRGLTESVESPLMRIFGGKFCSTVRAPNRSDTVIVEDWRPLQLDILPDSVHAIEDALAQISHPQPVQLGPSGSGEASKQVFLETLPPILVLHLKRFLYDVAADGIVKISKPVQFAPKLEIPLEIMASVAGKPVEPAHYKLYGVVYHHGESAGGGHYTVDVLHPNEDSSSGEAWLHIDDDVVSTVRHEDVFGGHDGKQVDDRCAYMLFYCRPDSV